MPPRFVVPADLNAVLLERAVEGEYDAGIDLGMPLVRPTVDLSDYLGFAPRKVAVDGTQDVEISAGVGTDPSTPLYTSAAGGGGGEKPFTAVARVQFDFPNSGTGNVGGSGLGISAAADLDLSGWSLRSTSSESIFQGAASGRYATIGLEYNAPSSGIGWTVPLLFLGDDGNDAPPITYRTFEPGALYPQVLAPKDDAPNASTTIGRIGPSGLWSVAEGGVLTVVGYCYSLNIASALDDWAFFIPSTVALDNADDPPPPNSEKPKRTRRKASRSGRTGKGSRKR